MNLEHPRRRHSCSPKGHQQGSSFKMFAKGTVYQSQRKNCRNGEPQFETSSSLRKTSTGSSLKEGVCCDQRFDDNRRYRSSLYPGKFMLVDCLTKSVNPDHLLNAMKKNQLHTVDIYDAEKVIIETIEEAGVDIPMES